MATTGGVNGEGIVHLEILIVLILYDFLSSVECRRYFEEYWEPKKFWWFPFFLDNKFNRYQNFLITNIFQNIFCASPNKEIHT